MGRETEKLLAAEDLDEGIEHEKAAHEFKTHECGKKHGILCRILTTLHLKKNKSDRHKLLSESQEHLPQPDEHPKGAKKHKRPKKKLKEETTKSKPKKRSVPHAIPRNTSSLSANSNGNCNVFSTTYEMLDNESHHSCEFLFEPEAHGQSVVEREEAINAAEDVKFQAPHIYSDENFGESCISRTDINPLIEKPKSPNTGQYLRHQWHGKRAKKARKRIRRVMRATFLSLQSATAQASNMFPSPHQVASVVSSSAS